MAVNKEFVLTENQMQQLTTLLRKLGVPELLTGNVQLNYSHGLPRSINVNATANIRTE